VKAEPRPLELHGLFTSGMVLQRGRKVPVWGWAAPGQEVSVSIEGQKATATAGENRKWTAWLEPMNAGGPHEVRISSGMEEIALDEVLVGDVWLASGQSNMEFRVQAAANAEEEIAAADFPRIRYFNVYHHAAPKPVVTLSGDPWVPATPEHVANFSATAYYFAREIHQEMDLPVGIIHSSWGGSMMEAWTRREALESDPRFDWAIERFEKWDRLHNDPEVKSAYQRELDKWKEQTGGGLYHSDPGNTKEAQDWADPGFDDSGWKIMDLPGPWEARGLDAIDGAVWFRRNVDIPEGWAGQDLELSLGALDDFDDTYFNGTRIGGLGTEQRDAWATPRVYTVPGGLVEPGENTIAVRIFDHHLGGGFTGSRNQLFIEPKQGGGNPISLAGAWKYRVAHERMQQPVQPGGLDPHSIPTALYNGKIAPLIPFAIKGLIWYQGESNANRYADYPALTRLMVEDWRRQWGQGEFPFLYVQLAGFQASGNTWPYLREAQLRSLGKIPNSAMAVAIDIGESADIHPRNKQDAGKRLARAALGRVYGRDIAASGPIYRDMEKEGDRIRIFFDETGSGLKDGNGGELEGFQVAGADGKFVPARADIQGGEVIVWSPAVAEPVAVRYAWDNFPKADLYNREGLPASPFRTDTWPRPE